MKKLKDGTLKLKPSAVKASEWMQQEPLPMRSFRKGTVVKVFMGAGWEKGKVVKWSKEGVSVWLSRKQATVTVRDNRCIKEETSK